MTDEPRRSGRATKGQHHKTSEEPETTVAPPPQPVKGRKGKGKGKGRGSKKVATEVEEEEEDEEPEAVIRCICGYVKEDPDDKRAMICCDKCSAWQHNVCMGFPEDEDDLPDQYFCEKCKPQDHQQTVLALKRREKIWDIRQAEHERQQEEEKQKKKGKKGRKSKGGRPSEVSEPDKPTNSQPSDQSSSQVIPPVEEDNGEKSEVGQKRKMSDQVATNLEDEDVVTTKSRRISIARDTRAPPRRQSITIVQSKGGTKHVELQTELVERIEHLHNRVRQRAAGAFVKTFEQITQQALVEGTFKLPNRQTIAAFALGLGLSVEFCLYINIWGHGSEPNPAYSEKMRVILHNVKANPELRDRLLNQSLSPSDLTQMSSDEMASRELQAEKAQIIKETEKQHILLPEAAPKFRKTHKGEELIEDSTNHFVNTESAPQLSTRIHEKGTKEESPERMGSHSPTAFQPTSFKQNANPLTVDTQARRKSTTERKSSSGFDMNNVWSSVDSPSAARPMVTPNTPGIKGPGAKADPEIDQLLGNDEEEPYSPMDYTMEPGMIWRGNIVMPTVAEFQANAKYAAGANLEKQYPWADVIGRTLWIEGRIQGDVASEYVCNLRFSKTTDVSIISLTPSDNTRDHQNFTKLFEYFTTRQRWGVGKSPLGHTRDVYIIPLESGNAPKPEFLNLLEDSAVGENRPNRMLLVIYIIKLTAPTTGTPATPAQQTVASPAINQQASNGSVNITMPDVTSSVDTKSIATNGPVLAIEPSQDGTGKKGREAAEFILGPVLSNAATVNHILTQALDCGEQQFMHIRACYLEDPRTMTDWPLLLTALTLRAQTTDAEIADEEEKKKRLATVA